MLFTKAILKNNLTYNNKDELINLLYINVVATLKDNVNVIWLVSKDFLLYCYIEKKLFGMIYDLVPSYLSNVIPCYSIQLLD